MKNVMLIGDSIRMGYCHRVRELLCDRANVWFSPNNDSFAKYTLWYFNQYLADPSCPTPDVIHWNNGIWDTYTIAPEIPAFTKLDEYLETLGLIYGQMSKTGAKVIFATTTPVMDSFVPDDNDRINRYNAAAVSYLTALGAGINDLHSLIDADREQYICEDLLHLSPAGVEVAAKQVVAAVEKYF